MLTVALNPSAVALATARTIYLYSPGAFSGKSYPRTRSGLAAVLRAARKLGPSPITYAAGPVYPWSRLAPPLMWAGKPFVVRPAFG